jgi:hypothetical protein
MPLLMSPCGTRSLPKAINLRQFLDLVDLPSFCANPIERPTHSLIMTATNNPVQRMSVIRRNSETIQPVDILVFKHKNASLLDTVFVSKLKRKPSWVTTTTGPITTIHSISRRGQLKEVAKIYWYQKGKNSDVMLEINGEVCAAEKFGRKKGHSNGEPRYQFILIRGEVVYLSSLVGSPDYFTIDELRCRWGPSASMTWPGIYMVSVGVILDCTADIRECCVT